jgi:hypothetical protein
VDSVPDPLLCRKSGVVPGIEPGPSGSVAGTQITRPQRRSLLNKLNRK